MQPQRCGLIACPPRAMALAQRRRSGHLRQRLPQVPGKARAGDGGGPRRTSRGLGMIWLPAMGIGAFWGARTALKRGGRRLDALQYGAVYAIGLGLVGALVSIVIDRLIH